WQEQHQITHTRTTLKAGRELNATFREDAVIAGLKAEAGEMIKINAQKDVLSLGVENLDHASHLVKSGGGLFGSRSREEVSRTRLDSLPDAFKAPLSLVNSEGNLLNQGTQYQGKAVLQAKGKASLQSSETLVEETKVCQSSSLVWQKTRSQGTIHQTYRPVAATEGLTVRANTLVLEFPKGQEIPENLTIEGLPTPLLEGPSEQPTEPLHLEVKHPQEVHKHWEQSHQGLTAGAAAVLGLAVTLATGTPLGNFAGGLTGATQGFAYAATKAGIQAVAAATVVGTVNHQGNAGRAVEDLGKPTALKSIATAIATAGLVGPAPEGGIFSANFAENLATHGAQHLSYGLQSGAVSFAINGGSAKDALKGAGLLAASSAVQASVANELGILRKEGLDSATHKIGHALGGAAAGAILDPKNPGRGALSGALGAVVGEVVAEALPENLTRETRADVGKIAAATGALLTKQDVPTAIVTADTALQNNWLLTGAIGGGLAVAANTEEGQKVLAEIEGATQAALEKERALGFENLNEAEQFLVGAYHTGVIKDFAYRELDALTNGKLSLVNDLVSKGLQWTGEVAGDALKSLSASETMASHGAAFTMGAVGSLVPSKTQALASIGKTGKTLTGPIKISRVEK
ncbi:MAG: DUF637 domain-containing protein, partial [Alphaproteobacteria bacterium]